MAQQGKAPSPKPESLSFSPLPLQPRRWRQGNDSGKLSSDLHMPLSFTIIMIIITINKNPKA